MPEFVKGLELSRLFFEEAVRPALAAEFPSLRYAAALVGTGSEVLGFDTEMSAALAAPAWQERERHLVDAYRIVAAMHNELGITDPLPAEPRDFFGRPFRVIGLYGFAERILEKIVDGRVRRIAARRPIGGIDLFSDSTDLASYASWRATLRRLYE